MREAVRFLSSLGTIVRQSDFYDSEAELVAGAPRYTNAVLRLSTGIPLHSFLPRCKEWESSLRSGAKSPDGVVAIDIDIVVWDSEILRPSDFTRRYFTKGYQEICD